MHLVVIFVKQFFLHEATAASVPASQEASEYRQHELGGVRREDVEGQSHAESCSYVPVPLDGEVIVITVEDGDEPEQHAVARELGENIQVEVDQEDDHADVDELHDRDLLELADGLIVLGVVLLQAGDGFKDEADDNVDNHHDQGGSNNQSLLRSIVYNPLAAVIITVVGLDVGETDVEYPRRIEFELSHAVAVHQTYSLLRLLLLIGIRLHLEHLLRADDGGLELFLEYIALPLHVDHSQDACDHNRYCDDCDQAPSEPPVLLAVADILPLYLVWQCRLLHSGPLPVKHHLGQSFLSLPAAAPKSPSHASVCPRDVVHLQGLLHAFHGPEDDVCVLYCVLVRLSLLLLLLKQVVLLEAFLVSELLLVAFFLQLLDLLLALYTLDAGFLLLHLFEERPKVNQLLSVVELLLSEGDVCNLEAPRHLVGDPHFTVWLAVHHQDLLEVAPEIRFQDVFSVSELLVFRQVFDQNSKV